MEKKSQGGCPFGYSSNSTEWRPKSSRVGIKPPKYVLWNFFYYVMEGLNRKLSFNPNRKISWDKWPTPLGVFYLMAKIRFNRSNALTDPYDYQTNDTKSLGAETPFAEKFYSTTGAWVSDNDNPQMGEKLTRFASNIPPLKTRPDVENMTPSARDVGKLRWRRLDPVTGKEIVIPALILNDLAGGWIHFEFHSFGGDTLRDPIDQDPHRIPRDPKDHWPKNEALISRVTKDPTRITENGRPTVINKLPVAWIQGQIYGITDHDLASLRSFEEGKLLIDKDGHLPADPNKPGIDKTGFNHDFHPILSLLHWLFVSEHNAIADHYASFHPDWEDEQLFQMARKVNIAMAARIHTIEWTKDMLQHPTLQLAMNCDWYGFLGQKTKMKLMRIYDRHPIVNRLMSWFRASDTFCGMPGSKWEHHDGPFQLPTQFRTVYRLHEMVLGEHEICEPGTNRTLARIDLLDFIHSNTRPIVEKFGYETLAWSFVKKSCGALTLHNFPRALTQFNNQQENVPTDLAERDIFRERSEGTGTYNDLRQSLGEPPVTTFLELTGGDVEIAKELETLYEGDINKVDLNIGILVEPKAAGFALGFVQFYQFVLNAPRRVKSNRLLTEGFTYKEYQEGMDWLEYSGGMLGLMARHLPGLKPMMEGVTRAFAPWQDTERFPFKLLNTVLESASNVFKADLWVSTLATITFSLFAFRGFISPLTAGLLSGTAFTCTFFLMVERALVLRFMDQCWKKCYTDKRAYFFGTLARAEKRIIRAANFSKIDSLILVTVVLRLAWGISEVPYYLDIFTAILLWKGRSIWKKANAFITDAQLLKISLRNRMREGGALNELPGQTSIEKAFSVFSSKRKNVATLSSIYKALVQSGIPRPKAIRVAFSLIFKLSRKTRRLFSISIPNLGLAVEKLKDPIFNKRGNIDEGELDLLFRNYAPGRDYLTYNDFVRMKECNRYDKTYNGRGSWLTSFVKDAETTLAIFADRIVKEEMILVAAISKETVRGLYDGTTLATLKRELTEGDLDPSPITTLRVLQSMSSGDLKSLYRRLQVGAVAQDGRGVVLSRGIIGCFFPFLSIEKLYRRGTIEASPSYVDGRDARSKNTLFIHHEYREVSSGLFLGKAYLRFLRIPLMQTAFWDNP